MRVSVFILAALAVTVVSANKNDEKIREVGHLQHIVIGILWQWGGPYFRKHEEITAAKEKAYSCLGGIKANNTFCETFVKHFEKCVTPMLKIIEEVDGPKEGPIPAALIKAMISYAEYLCNVDGEHILETLNPCIFEALKSEASEKCGSYVNNQARVIANSTSNFVPEICKAVEATVNCERPEIQAKCKNNITRAVLTETVSALTAPCNAV